MRTKEEIRAAIDAQQAAQDASLRLMGGVYVRWYEHLEPIFKLLDQHSKDSEDIRKARDRLGHFMHDMEPSRLNYQARSRYLKPLYDEMRAWRAAHKVQEVPADHG